MDFYQKLKEAGYVRNNLGQRKNNYGGGGIFYRLRTALKMKLWYTIDKYGKLDEKKTFKGYYDSERLLNTDKYFKLQDGKMEKQLMQNFIFHGQDQLLIEKLLIKNF